MAFDPNRPIFISDTTTQNWGNIKGQQILTARSEERRGRNYELGIELLAQINNLINKWAQLKILVDAKASAVVQAQIQTPLDLFDEAGLAVRLRAVLEAAVAVGLSMNITMGQLAEMLKAKPQGRGLSGQLLEILLNETQLEGALFGQYAVGFMAYANFVTVGSLHKNENFPEPAFQFLYEVGMGFIVGGGYRSYIHVAMPHPRRLVELFSNKLIDGIIGKAIASQRDQAIMLGAMLRIGILVSYEISDQLSSEISINTDEIARKVVTIVWRQLQRVVFLQMGLFFRNQVVSLLNRSGLPSDQTAPVLRSLQDIQPLQFPSYSSEMFTSVTHLASSIQEEAKKQDMLAAVSALWAAAYFITSTSQDTGGISFPEFSGALPTQFSLEVRHWINTSLNRDKDASLTQKDLLRFLLDKPVASALQGAENISDIGKIVGPTIGSDAQQGIQRLFSTQAELTSTGGFRTVLSTMSRPFDDYVDREISGRSEAISNVLFDEPEIVVLFQRGLVPGIQIVSDILLPEVAKGFQNYDRKTMQEMLSGALLTMLGRSVVYVMGTLTSVVNTRIENILRDAARNVTSVLKPLGVQDIVRKPLEEAVKIIADQLAPLPANVQNQLFERAANLVSPIEGNAVEYANRLKNDVKYMPQLDEIEGIAKLLLQHLSGNMINFAVKLIPALFQALIDELLEKIEQLLGELNKILDTFVEIIKNIVTKKILDQLVGPFLELAKNSAEVLSFNIFDLIGAGQVKAAFFKALDGAVRSAVERDILPIILLPVNALKLDPRKIVDTFRGVSDLSFDTFDRLFTNQIFEQIETQLSKALRMKRIGLDLEVPVSFSVPLPWPLGEQSISHTFRLADLVMPSSQVLNLIMKVIRDNFRFAQHDNQFSLLVRLIQQVLTFQDRINQLQQEKLQALQKYSS
ncbi:hypothetical protein [Paenibacillus oleatilyticus]|uniref:hypothetical protein n=1 Tax=Paenibacillus oleatilyticus TaxID=2594886 RepID=UPI001C1FADA5|nr:hypothetical protein [Paenibacillus oleatilyticus]MBU7319524.1 hypothetical protein [Paenibacillus oleatilyticus]